MGAMGRGRKSGDVIISTHSVLTVGDRIEMGRVHAHRVPAEMVEHQSSRDLTDHGFVRESVCSHTAAAANGELPVSSNETPDPDPALFIASAGYFPPEPLLHLATHGRTSLTTRTQACPCSTRPSPATSDNQPPTA
jgi:hypothetical protein